MHIPDGYLGPDTFIAFWIIMIPIWYYAGQKLTIELKSRQVPLLALSAAFSFVIMMFNIPTPWGSSGHAVGGGIIAIIIGPWASIIAISVTLVLQALIFGDGGVTTIATNCFNMGVVIPFVAYYTYRLISRNSEIMAPTRVIAAAIAGWISLTIASFFAGFELGIQPILEHTTNGYMPYSLSATVPAMVLEHALIFSILEAMITAIIFAYIQRTDTSVFYGEKSKEERNKMMRKRTI